MQPPVFFKLRRLGLVSLLLLLLLPSFEAARAESPPVYRVERFVPLYGVDHPELPRPEALAALEVELAHANGARGWTPVAGAPPDATPARFSLAAVPATHAPIFSTAGIRHVNQALVAELNRRGWIGVYVAPHPEDIEPDTGRDLRAPGQASLRLRIEVGRAKRVRTVAAGARASVDERIDLARHARIRAHSPVQPADDGDAALMRGRALEDYVHRLNRHPRRTVQLSLSPGLEPGSVNLDYLVSEDRPWSLYAQTSNTGTESTEEWRQRFGFAHYQLTGRDDILRLDYVTGNFDEVHAVNASYEGRVLGSERLRWRVGGGWSEYDASQLGFPDARFRGEQRDAELSLIANVFQREETFVDLAAGLRWLDVEVENELLATRAEEDVVVPQLRLLVERTTATAALSAGVIAEASVPSLTGADSRGLAALGRFPVDDDWVTLQWYLVASAFLEPLFDREAWADPSTPGSSTLAHELSLSLRGQYAFDDRLIPQAQQVAGGLFSVRGYPQSAVAGDDLYLASLEYRFHLPRVFDLEREPRAIPALGSFRVAPGRVYGRPDWDLVFRVFYDFGRVLQSERQPFEDHETLHGVGAGLELVLKESLRVRLDWGRALSSARDGAIRAGSNEYHLIASLLF